MNALPRVFEYENYRVFLKDLYQALKLKDKKFSLRYFARIAGFNSHNFLRMVMIGKGNLSDESIAKFALAFKFNREESQFFKNLVLLNQSTNDGERQIHIREILRSKTYRKTYPLRESQYQYFKHWYFSAVRELVGLPGFKEDPHWIAKHVIPSITVLEAKKAVDELIKLGLLKRDERGRIIQTDSKITTPDEVSSAYLSNWHKEYLKRAAESIDNVKRDERDISAVYLLFTRENVKILKEMIHKFRLEVLELEASQQNPDAVFHLNLQLFPVAKTDSEDT